MSFLTREPGILVADLVSGGYEGVRPNTPAGPAVRLLSRKTGVSGLPRVSAAQRLRLATSGVDQIATMATSDSYMTAEIAAAITAN